MTIEDHLDGKLVTLSQSFDNRAKILNVFYFTVFFAWALSYFLWIFKSSSSVGSIFIGTISIAFLIISYRFANKAAQTEKLFINDDQIRLIRKGLFKSEERSFDRAGVSNFRYLEKRQLPKHPLEGQSMDYLGFGVSQEMINELHGDNRLAFDYNGYTIAFGENIYSWEFDELVPLLRTVS